MVLQSFTLKTSILLHTHLSHVGLKCVDKVKKLVIKEVVI